MSRIITKSYFKWLIKQWMIKNGFKIKYYMKTSCNKKDLFIHYTIKDMNNKIYDLIVDGRKMDIYEPAKISISELTPIRKNLYTQGVSKIFYIDVNTIPLYN